MSDAMATIRAMDVLDIERRITYLEQELIGWKTIRALKRVIDATSKLPDGEAQLFLPSEREMNQVLGEIPIVTQQSTNRMLHSEFKNVLVEWVNLNDIVVFKTSQLRPLFIGMTTTSMNYHLRKLEDSLYLTEVKEMNGGILWAILDGAKPEWAKGHYAGISTDDDIDMTNKRSVT